MEELPDTAGRQGMGHENKLIALQLTPGTRITVPQFNEIHGPLEFGAPLERLDPLESWIDLYKRSGSQHWPERVIVEADVAIVRMSDVQMLD
jgi:hypothetical protein